MVDEKYLEKLESWYKKCKKCIRNTVFADNYYENKKSHLLKPVFKSETDVNSALLSYHRSHDENIKKLLFDHFMTLLLYISAHEMRKLKFLCDDIQEYISFNSSMFIKCLDLYNPNNMTAFTTYYIDSSNKMIRDYLMDIYQSGIYIGRSVRYRFETAMKIIADNNYSLTYLYHISKSEFKNILGISRYAFNKLLNLKFLSLDLEYYDNITNERFELYQIISDKIDYEEIIINNCLIDNICKYLENKVSSRDYNIWKRYYITSIGDPMEFIGKDYNMSRERIRQIIYKCNEIVRTSKAFKHISK
jgi:DNA-directed RNA polymerase specialized sigma subunit